MNIGGAYTDWSTSYDTDPNLTRDLDAAVTRRVLGQQHHETILELGCGTGKNTGLLAELGRRVLALDFSEGMIRKARAKVQRSNILFAVADLGRPWPCGDRTVQMIVCNLVLEHMADLAPIFAEAYRVSAPGGLFLISELHPFRQYSGKQATFHRGDQEIAIAAYVHHISDFLDAAAGAGFSLASLREWWHETDQAAPPRLVSFMFEKQ